MRSFSFVSQCLSVTSTVVVPPLFTVICRSPGRHAGDVERARVVGHGEIRRVDDDDVALHLGVEPAELRIRARLVEGVLARLAVAPRAEVVRALGREDVVLDRVVVEPLHGRARDDRRHVRHEVQVLLIDHHRGVGRRDLQARRVQADDDVGRRPEAGRGDPSRHRSAGRRAEGSGEQHEGAGRRRE